MKKFVHSILLSSLIISGAAIADGRTDLYFDLGKVVVNSHDINNLTYMPEAKTRIETLKNDGYSANLIINFVDKFGEEVFADCEQKMKGLMRFVDARWRETEAFDWAQFDRVILPPKDAMRKPKPYMFVNALAQSCPKRVVVFSEAAEEVEMSNFLGIAGYQVAVGDLYLIPDSQYIKDFTDANFRFSYPQSCRVNIPEQCVTNKEKLIEYMAEIRQIVPQ